MSGTTTTDGKAALHTIDAFYRAWAAADPEAMARLYTLDATAVSPMFSHAGRDEIRAYFEAGFAGRLAGSTAVDTPRSVRLVGPDTTVVVSDGGVLMPGETSVAAERRLVATWVLVRQDGEWLIAAYHNCAAQPG
jgi:uncharacterized protein (TIGR02246 family)